MKKTIYPTRKSIVLDREGNVRSGKYIIGKYEKLYPSGECHYWMANSGICWRYDLIEHGFGWDDYKKNLYDKIAEDCKDGIEVDV